MAEPWVSRGLGALFETQVRGLNKYEDTVFGTAADRATGLGAKNLRSVGDLAAFYRPLQGEFSSTGAYLGGAFAAPAAHVGGTGPTVINSEIQRYTSGFSGAPGEPACHVMEADGLRIRAMRQAGTFNSYLRGQVLTSGAGINVNAPGGTTVTALADATITVGDLANVEIGDVATNGAAGLMVVTAKNTGASTITFESISGGVRTAYKANYHITFTKFAFAQVATNVTNGTTTSITFATALPSSVVVGCFALGIDRTANPVFEPRGRDRATVQTISGDRLTVTFNAPVHFDTATLTAANFDGVLFLPQLWSGQIWSRQNYGPHIDGRRVQGLRVTISLPPMPHCNGNNAVFTKAQVEALYAGAPSVVWGAWPAVWLDSWRPGPNGNGQLLIAGGRDPHSELDVFESFNRVSHGPSVWTGNLHDQPYTRRRVVNTGGSSRIPGATWLTTAANSLVLSPDSTYLGLSASLCTGAPVSFEIIWTPDTVHHYVNGLPFAVSDWSVDTDYPHQLGINTGCGSLSSSNCSQLFFPQSNAEADANYVKVHRIEAWEL